MNPPTYDVAEAKMKGLPPTRGVRSRTLSRKHNLLMLNLRSLSVFVALAATLSVHAEDTPPVIFRVEGSTVAASGLTAGGAAAVLNVSIESSGSSSIATRTWRNARADAGGAITAAFSDPIAEGAFIAVIDVETGRIAKTADAETRFKQEPFPAKRLKRNADADVDQVWSPNASVMIVVVRPGVGAWLSVAHDGGTGDADGIVDGRITTDPAALRPIAYSSEPPRKIRPRDVVLMGDPDCLCFAMTEVTP